MGRKLNFCEELASLMCYPFAFEIGGVSSSLKEVIKTMTVKNASIKKLVLDICKERVCNGDFDICAYNTDNAEEALLKIEEDYNIVFFK